MYDVYPRYTPGSPGCVDEETAFRVRDEEIAAHQAARAGFHGEEERARAEREGLGGIVVALTPKGKRDAIAELFYGDVPGRCFRHPEDTLVVRSGASRTEYFYRRRPLARVRAGASEIKHYLAVRAAIGLAWNVPADVFERLWAGRVGA